MNRTPVKSSMLKAVGYDGAVLEAQFANGDIYRYEGITQAQFDALLGAESVGAHFNKVIRPACTACWKAIPEKKKDAAA